MAKYKVLERSFIGNAIVEAGEVVDYDGEVSTNLELVVEEEVAAKKGRKAAQADQAGEATE